MADEAYESEDIDYETGMDRRPKSSDKSYKSSKSKRTRRTRNTGRDAKSRRSARTSDRGRASHDGGWKQDPLENCPVNMTKGQCAIVAAVLIFGAVIIAVAVSIAVLTGGNEVIEPTSGNSGNSGQSLPSNNGGRPEEGTTTFTTNAGSSNAQDPSTNSVGGWYDNGKTFSPTASPCAKWIQIGTDIDGETENEKLGSTVSLSREGTHVAMAGFDVARSSMYQNAAKNWRKTSDSIWGINGGGENVIVSMSGDGKRMAVGMPYTDPAVAIGTDAGQVRVFEYIHSSDTWSQVGPLLEGNPLDKNFGISTILSDDGTRLAVGSQYQVRVYDYIVNQEFNATTPFTWDNVRRIRKFMEEGETFGEVVSMSSDGTRLAVGEPKANDDRGQVTVYQLDPDYDVLNEIAGNAPEERFGKSVALSGDGNILSVGAYWGDFVQNFEYAPDNRSWKLFGHRIEGYSLFGASEYGRSISLSNDGLRLAVSAPFANDKYRKLNETGVVQVFQHDIAAGTWDLIGNNIYGENAKDYAGWSVSMSGNGNRLAIGADYNDGFAKRSGHVRVYELQDNC